MTNSKLPVGKVAKLYYRRGYVENRIKEEKNTLRRAQTSCFRFSASQGRLLMGVLVYNVLHMFGRFYLVGEEVRRSMEWPTRGLIQVGAKIAYRLKVVCLCGFSLPFVPILQICHRVKASKDIMIDWKPYGEVRSKTEKMRLYQ